jgi:cytochrome c553
MRISPRQANKVVEADTVPKTQVTGWHLAMAPEGGTEPIGQRIIEVPENLAISPAAMAEPSSSPTCRPVLSRRARSGGKTITCRICHGQDLKGLGNILGIAGRSPSYIVRQLYDLQVGNRAGINAALMKPVVDKLRRLWSHNHPAVSCRPTSTTPAGSRSRSSAGSNS